MRFNRCFRLVLLLSLLTSSLPVLSDDDKNREKLESKHSNEEFGEKESSGEEKSLSEKKGEPSNFGAGKGVIDANEKDGIKLSPKAVEKLGLKTEKIASSHLHTLPLGSLIYFQEEVGVYRLRSGFFKLIEGKVVKKKSGMVTLEASGLVAGDQVVTQGAALLRLTDLNIWSGSGDGDAD